MRYMGSKRLLAKHILPIILKDRQEGQWYVEPFCGGCNTLSEVEGPRIGADSHYYLIEMWKAVSLGWLPIEHLSEWEYTHINKNRDLLPCLTGYVGFACSYGGKWFGGYPRDRTGIRDLIQEQYRASLKQFPRLKGVIFDYSGYDGLDIPERSIVYCDPPYECTTGYGKQTAKFIHEHFWQWVRGKVKEGHRVFVSEYKAPDDFVCIWEKVITSGLSTKKGNEKLFIHKSQEEKGGYV